MAYVLPAIQKKLYPTWTEASRATQSADKEGDSKDVRPLMSILQRIAENGVRCVSNLETRQTAITSFTWSIAPRDGTTDTAELDRANAARKRLGRVIRQLLKWHTTTIAYGAFVVDLTWDDSPLLEGGFKLPRIAKRYLPTEIERTSSDAASINVLVGDATVTRRKIDLEAPGGTIADTDSFFQVGGLLRPIMWFEIARNEALQEWVNFNKKLKGLILAILKEWATSEDESTANAALANIATNQYAAVKESVGFEFKSMVDHMGATSFSEFIKMCEDAQSILLLGQANTTRLPEGGGSRAAVQVQQLIQADKHYADIVRCEELINEQLLRHDARVNLGLVDGESPFEFRINIEEDEDPEKNARVIGEALDAGIALRRSEVYERLGFTPPEPGEEVVQKQPAGGLL